MKKSGNGGYPLMAESLLPIVRDLNSEEGREELNLKDDKLTGVTITRFRLRPGDDASCLNLYQPRNPRILGVNDGFIGESRFAFQSSPGEIQRREDQSLVAAQREFRRRRGSGCG